MSAPGTGSFRRPAPEAISTARAVDFLAAFVVALKIFLLFSALLLLASLAVYVGHFFET